MNSNPLSRITSLELLHPIVRKATINTLSSINQDQERIFAVFETFRSPQRQRYLFEQGRSRGGKVVTRSDAWSSMHQYGLAVDIVLYENNQPSWDVSGQRLQAWRRMQQFGKQFGLATLSFELPHLQLPLNDIEWSRLMRGTIPDRLVDTADDSWWEGLKQSYSGWPGSPNFHFPEERPPLVDVPTEDSTL